MDYVQCDVKHGHSALLRVLQLARQHKSLNKLSPAMAAEISDRLWSMEEIVALIDAAEGEPKKRGSYKRRQNKLAAQQGAI
jgi:hypothetical protein